MQACVETIREAREQVITVPLIYAILSFPFYVVALYAAHRHSKRGVR
jgi:hypothetical protein